LRGWGAIYGVHDGVASGATPDCMRYRLLATLPPGRSAGVFVVVVVVVVVSAPLPSRSPLRPPKRKVAPEVYNAGPGFPFESVPRAGM
jgi:hypothetical protein